VYAGLSGPVLTVSEREQSGEAALARALSLLELGAAPAVVAGAAEAHDPIVARVLGTTEQGVTRSEGGGFLTVEDEALAAKRGARVLARIVRHEQVLGELAEALERTKPSGQRATVLLAAVGPRVTAALADSPWSSARRLSVLERSGYHEASGAIALCAGVALVAAAEADDVLVVSGRGSSAYVTHLSGAGR
jgi:3-oxoacyl-(acyl-carrier-protein) synthase